MYRYLSLGFGIFILLLFVTTGIAGLGFQRLAMYYPVTVSLIGTLLSLIYVIQQVNQLRKPVEASREDPDMLPFDKAFVYLAWFIGYILLISVVGLMVSTACYLGVFLYFQAKMRWWGVLISIASALLVLNLISQVMNLYWPRSLLGW